PGSPAAGQAADIIIAEHLKSSRIQNELGRYTFGPLYWGERLLRAAVKADVPEANKLKAKFCLATLLMSKGSVQSTLLSMSETMQKAFAANFGESYVRALLAADPAKSNDEALRLFTEVANSPGAGAQEKERAKAALFELQNLAVGRPAPD